jgi:hypothetical protein
MKNKLDSIQINLKQWVLIIKNYKIIVQLNKINLQKLNSYI